MIRDGEVSDCTESTYHHVEVHLKKRQYRPDKMDILSIIKSNTIQILNNKHSTAFYSHLLYQHTPIIKI